MSANLVLHGNVRYGRTVHISFDGVDMVFDGAVPVTVNQQILLGLLTGACVLELRGTVEAVRETAGASGIPGEVSSSDVAVKFDPIAALERQVLGSLLDAFRDHCLAVSMATLLVAEEAGDLLLEAGSLSPQRTHADPFPFSSGNFSTWNFTLCHLLPVCKIGNSGKTISPTSISFSMCPSTGN
jgi:hypothetical protein